jgi:hypothetical protein
MLMNINRHRNHLQPMRWVSMPPWGSCFGGESNKKKTNFFYCPNLFPSNSQWVFNMFPSFQCVPQHFPHKISFYFIYLALSSTLVTNSTSPKGEHYNICILGLSNSWFFFIDEPIKNAHEKRKEEELWESPRLIDMNHIILGRN